MKKNKADISRDKIIKTSLKLFSIKGFNDVSIQKIADTSGYSQATVLYYYKTKLGLLEAVFKHILISNKKFISELDSPSLNARELIDINFRGNINWCVKKPGEAKIIMLLYYEASKGGIFRKLFLQIVTNTRERFSRILYAGIREKVFKINQEEIAETAEILQELLLGGLINFSASGSPKDLKKVYLNKWDKAINNLLKV